jgi:hypothetical protein
MNRIIYTLFLLAAMAAPAAAQTGAGARFGVVGDYLYRDQISFPFSGRL